MAGSIPFNPLPTVQPAAPSGAYETGQATPADMGAQVAQATGQLGQAIDQAGNVAADAAIKFQQIQNKTNVDDVYANQFSPQFRQMYQQYYALQGKDAVDQMPDFLKKMEDFRSQVSDALPNSAQRIMFNDQSRRRVEMEMDGMARYADVQNKVWRDTTFDSSLKNLTDQISDKYNDEPAFGNGLGLASHLIDSYAAQTGKPAEWIHQKYSDFQGVAETERLDRWMTQDPMAANAFYKANGNLFPAAAKPQIEAKLHAMVTPWEAKNVASQAMTMSATEQALTGEGADSGGQGIPGMKGMEGTPAQIAASMQGVPDKDRAAIMAQMQRQQQAPDGTTTVAKPLNADPRANLMQWMQNGDQLAEKLHPGDPVFQDLVRTQIRGYVGSLTAAQEGQQRQAHQTLITAAMGSQGRPKPVTIDDLLQTPEARQAWVTTDPSSQRGVLALLEHNAKEARGELTRSDPAVVNGLRGRMYLPDGDPNKISSPTQLLPYATNVNGTDLDKLRKEVLEANTPEGNPFLKQTNGVKETARKMLTGSMSTATQAHPELAEEAAYRFSADLDAKIKATRTAGKDPQTLFDPANPDYVLAPSRVAAFMPSEQEIAAQKAAAAHPAAQMPTFNEYDTLKSGTQYTDPQGNVRTKR